MSSLRLLLVGIDHLRRLVYERNPRVSTEGDRASQVGLVNSSWLVALRFVI